MTTNALEVQGLRRVFTTRGPEGTSDHVAVDDVTFTVAEGSCLAIVGESGSGKTTTARIIAGLDRADAGHVLVHGQSEGERERGTRRSRRPVQMVFQDPFGSLDPRQRVGAAIEEVIQVSGRTRPSERQRLVYQLLAQVGLDDRHAGELPRHLSGGQRQRVAIARALAMSPRVLILDEAVSALDVSVQAQVLNLLSDIRQQTGITYLFVSHDLAVVRQVSDHCLVMQSGRVVEAGATDRVLDDPQKPYTRQLLDAIPRPGWTPRRRSSR